MDTKEILKENARLILTAESAITALWDELQPLLKDDDEATKETNEALADFIRRKLTK